jgi:hypothetical protein
MPINPHSRLAQRGYNLNHRQCAVAGCTNPPRSGLSGLCDRHRTAFRRLGHYEQEFPDTYALNDALARMSAARGRIKHKLVPGALEAQYETLASNARATCEPVYKASGRQASSRFHTEAAQVVRDAAEHLPFERFFDLLSALHLIRIERPGFFKADDQGEDDASFRCVLVEALRRVAKVDRKWLRDKGRPGAQHTYRKDMSRQVRLEVGKLIDTALGGAARELARIEANRIEQERATRASYHETVSAIAQAQPSYAAELQNAHP